MDASLVHLKLIVLANLITFRFIFITTQEDKYFHLKYNKLILFSKVIIIKSARETLRCPLSQTGCNATA